MKRRIIMAMCAATLLAGCATTSKDSDAKETLIERAEANGKAKRTLTTEYFTNIELKSSVDVVFTQTNGGKPKVTIVGDKKSVERVCVNIHGETLSITQKDSYDTFFNSGSGNATVYISAPDLTSVKALGSGDFEAKGTIDTDNLKISIIGSGDVEMKSVVCDNAEIEIVGSGDIDIDRLTAQATTSIKSIGSGDTSIDFWKSGNVSCESIGSGDLELKGTVRKLRTKVTGSGDISTQKLKKW